MTTNERKLLRQRLVPATTALVTLGAIVGFSQLSAHLTTGAAPEPAPSRSLPAAAGPSGEVLTISNTAPASSIREYWTKTRTDKARPLTPTRTDAGPASFGSANLDFTRSRITPQTGNTAVPYRTTGKLFFSAPGGDFVCSASVIAARVVITAAHCMHSGSAFYDNWAFVPGYDGTRATLAQQRPFGTWTYTGGAINSKWAASGGSLPNEADFGALVFADQNIGGTTKKIADVVGKYKVSLNHLFDNHVTMLGYPCNFDSCNIMQRVDSSDHRIPPGYTAGDVYEYGSDMTGGSSGGPWLENFGVGATVPSGPWKTRNGVVAVTSYIYLDGGSALVEGASELDEDWTVINNFVCATSGNC